MRNLRIIFIKKFIRERGGYFGIIGTMSITLPTIISFVIYASSDPSFNIITHPISDLGTGPNMSNVVYNIGAIVTGFLLVFLHLSVVSLLQDRNANAYLVTITKLLSVISAIGLIILGIIPFERDKLFFFLGHGSAAATHYVAGSIAFICYGIFEILILKFSKILGIQSFLTGIIYGSVWIGYLIDYIFKIPQENENYIFQWISLAGIILWSLMHSLYLIKIKKNSDDPN